MAKSKAGDDGSAMKKRKAPSNPDVGGAKSKKVAGASAKKRGGATAEQRWRPMPVRLDFGSAFCRHVFLRAPSKGADGAEEGTALFVAAVPPGWSKSTLREFMSRFGDVADASLVTLDSAPDVAGGLVRFADARGTKRALAAAVRGGAPLDPPASTARAVGLESWVADFRDAAPPPDVLQSRIDEWWVEFDAETARKEAAARAGGEEDDGWTVVEAKRGRRKTTDGEGTSVGGIRAATADARRTEGPKIRENFYRFQQREKRRNELFELKRAFEADKDRVAKLKASRKFKPM